MKAIEWALALLLGSVSLLFISLNIVVMIWGYKISQSILHKPHDSNPWIENISYDECAEYEMDLKQYVRENSKSL